MALITTHSLFTLLTVMVSLISYEATNVSGIKLPYTWNTVDEKDPRPLQLAKFAVEDYNREAHEYGGFKVQFFRLVKAEIQGLPFKKYRLTIIAKNLGDGKISNYQAIDVDQTMSLFCFKEVKKA